MVLAAGGVRFGMARDLAIKVSRVELQKSLAAHRTNGESAGGSQTRVRFDSHNPGHVNYRAPRHPHASNNKAAGS